MITEKENALFEEWKSTIPQDTGAIFVTDGVVDEEAWLRANTKVLYLLKEVNGAEKSWDERDYLKRYNSAPEYIATHSQTINNLMRWQYGITYGKSMSWNDVESALKNKEVQDKVLSELCLVNAKKTAGGGLVDWNEFGNYFDKDINRTYLRQQLELYEPDFVICGGTAYYLSCLYGLEYSDWKETSRGVRYMKCGKTVYIDFSHPNNRGPKNLIYYGLLDAVCEIRKETT